MAKDEEQRKQYGSLNKGDIWKRGKLRSINTEHRANRKVQQNRKPMEIWIIK